MVAAMAGFAVEDVFLKAAAASLSLGQIMLTVGILGLAVFAMLARVRGEAVFPAAFLARGMLVRSGFEVVGRLFYALAVALTPLSSASAILQATPLLVVAAAALVMGEKVGSRRWLAVLTGFAGVLVILRPGLAAFDALSMLAVAGMIGFAGRDLATRAASPSLSNRQLGIAGFAMLSLSGAIILGATGGAVLPGARAAAEVAACAGFAVAAYAALTGAMRNGEVSVVTPFRYARLVFAMILGVTVFGECPDAATLLGSALIVGSGLYAMHRACRRTGKCGGPARRADWPCDPTFRGTRPRQAARNCGESGERRRRSGALYR